MGELCVSRTATEAEGGVKAIVDQLQAMLADESIDPSVRHNIRIALVHLNTAARMMNE